MRDDTRSEDTRDAEGWRGWDEYAEFYDWENARTMGRRDVRFWQAFARDCGTPLLELGSGTGRVTVPLARTGVRVVGVDRSQEMLARARRRVVRLPRGCRPLMVRADITRLPCSAGVFAGVCAPYGILQSLISEAALRDTLQGVARALRPGGRFGLELVPDVPRWKETRQHVSLVGLHGPNGKPVTLVESVRQDRARHLTVFEHEFLEGTGSARRRLRFTVRFRTLRLEGIVRRLEAVGLVVEDTFGGYHREPWSEDAGAWIVLARKAPGR